MKKMERTTPKARQVELVVRELNGETLVYDLERHQAHCLNPTAALVWKHCDGRTTPAAVARSIAKQLNTVVDEDVVWLALEQLEKFHLLEESITRPVWRAEVTRREMVRKYLPAALALPVVMSIAVPTAAQTASQCAMMSNRPNNCDCTLDAQCASGCCSPGGPGSVCSPATACETDPP